MMLAEPEQASLARAVLAERLGREVAVQGTGHVLDVASPFQPGSAAVLRPLNVLAQAGIAIAGLELTGLVTEITDEALRRVVHDWSVGGNTGPYRRRMERLAGLALLDRCLAEADAAEHSVDTDAAAWRFAVWCVAFNTAGAERRLLDAAVSGDDDRADDLVDAASARVQLARVAGLAIDIPAEGIASALRRRGYVVERAAQLASLLPAPLDPVVGVALSELADRGGGTAPAALAALRGAAPSPGVRATADVALASDDPNIRAAGLALLARHWTDDARPLWREFLASTSAPMRWTAEEVIREYGTEADLRDAETDAAMSEELLTWPSPSVERDGTSFMLVFDEVGAHQPVRERFEELAERHPSVEVIDGDREWISVAIDTDDPEALVRELWSAAGEVRPDA